MTLSRLDKWHLVVRSYRLGRTVLILLPAADEFIRQVVMVSPVGADKCPALTHSTATGMHRDASQGLSTGLLFTSWVKEG